MSGAAFGSGLSVKGEGDWGTHTDFKMDYLLLYKVDIDNTVILKIFSF